MNEFDPIKAATEELTGLVDVHKVLIVRARDAERAHAEAEADRNAMMKLERFTADIVERARERVQHLQEEKQRADEAKAGENDGK